MMEDGDGSNNWGVSTILFNFTSLFDIFVKDLIFIEFLKLVLDLVWIFKLDFIVSIQ